MCQGVGLAFQRVRAQEAYPEAQGNVSWESPVRLATLYYIYSHPQPALGLLSVPSKTHSLCTYPPHRYTQPFPTGEGELHFLNTHCMPGTVAGYFHLWCYII